MDQTDPTKQQNQPQPPASAAPADQMPVATEQVAANAQPEQQNLQQEQPLNISQAATINTPATDGQGPASMTPEGSADGGAPSVVPVAVIDKKQDNHKLMYIIAGILFLITIGGGVFLAMNMLSPKPPAAEEVQNAANEEPAIQVDPTPVVEAHSDLPPESGSDDIDALEEDLNAADLGDLDEDLSTLDGELGN